MLWRISENASAGISISHFTLLVGSGPCTGTNWKKIWWWPVSSRSITPQSRPPIGVARKAPLASMSSPPSPPRRTKSATSRALPSTWIVPRMRAPSVRRYPRLPGRMIAKSAGSETSGTMNVERAELPSVTAPGVVMT
jgi:hypothetical protein